VTSLVGPVPTMRMHDGTRLIVDSPRNTLDYRYPLCRRHHTGCWCYEAERNETLSEYRSMYFDVVDTAKEILAGHRTRSESYRPRGDWSDSVWLAGNGRLMIDDAEMDEDAVCMCTGCQIARKAHLL